MNYYTQLNNLETELIRLDTLTSLVSVITAGFENSANYKDLQNTMYLLEDSLNQTNEKIRYQFDELWNVIRDETHDFDEPFDESFEQEYEVTGDSTIANIEYDFAPVENVMNTWTK